MGRARYDQLVELLPAVPTIVGIDERTALIIDPHAATWWVMGKGKVTVVRDGREESYPREQTFDLDELGPFSQLSDPKINIPDEVWDRVLTAHTAARLQEEEPIPSSEVVALLEKRNAARLQRDWISADKLRDRIESLGWRVIDTLEGSQLEPL